MRDFWDSTSRLLWLNIAFPKPNTLQNCLASMALWGIDVHKFGRLQRADPRACPVIFLPFPKKTSTTIIDIAKDQSIAPCGLTGHFNCSKDIYMGSMGILWNKERFDTFHWANFPRTICLIKIISGEKQEEHSTCCKIIYGYKKKK